jgi:hypothetical protein
VIILLVIRMNMLRVFIIRFSRLQMGLFLIVYDNFQFFARLATRDAKQI